MGRTESVRFSHAATGYQPQSGGQRAISHAQVLADSDPLCAWAKAYRAQQELLEQNLLLAALGGAGQPGSVATLGTPALLLGPGALAGRAVRMAYTGAQGARAAAPHVLAETE